MRGSANGLLLVVPIALVALALVAFVAGYVGVREGYELAREGFERGGCP